jgi:SAM-dependent methyltransferase
VRAGIPSFCEHDFYWNHLSRETMAALLSTAREEGYRRALERHLLPGSDRHTLRYALDERRADFRVVLPLTSESRLLDLGCGWGAAATALARHCGLVVGADSTRETLEFISVRAAQEELPNLRLAHIDPLDFGRLPFPERAFDAVVMNGVLEWVGKVRTREPAPALQVGILREARRVLKPGGCLYVGIENRYSALYFAGRRDHGGLPFTSVLPRVVADAMSRLLIRQPYRTYTYTRRGYASLLARAGFGTPSFYLPLPTYHKPSFILPLDDRQPLRHLLREQLAGEAARGWLRGAVLRAAQALSWTGLHKAICPGFGIVARACS